MIPHLKKKINLKGVKSGYAAEVYFVLQYIRF